MLDAVREWKSHYERQMVRDIEAMLEKRGFCPVYLNFDLASRFPKHSFPEIGDYDILAINSDRKELWLIEAKVLRRVGSIYEFAKEQESFFDNNKNDAKFQKRIDFFRENISEISQVMSFDFSDYDIVPYMVVNRIFSSIYKDVNFPIVSFYELDEILEKLD